MDLERMQIEQRWVSKILEEKYRQAVLLLKRMPPPGTEGWEVYVAQQHAQFTEES